MNGQSVARSGSFVACLLTVLVVGALAVIACGSGDQTATPEPTAASPAAEPTTLTERVSYSFTTPADGKGVLLTSPAFTSEGGRLIARLVIDRWGTADYPTEWRPGTGFYLEAPGAADWNLETAAEAQFDLVKGTDSYESEFLMPLTDAVPAAGDYELHIEAANIDGTITVLEAR